MTPPPEKASGLERAGTVPRRNTTASPARRGFERLGSPGTSGRAPGRDADPVIGEFRVDHHPLPGHVARDAIGFVHRADAGLRPQSLVMAVDARLIPL